MIFYCFENSIVFWEKTSNYFLYLSLPFNSSLIYSIKFLVSLFFLIFIRAGLPRYRYDYLTKLGWSNLLILSLFSLIYVYFFFIIV